MFADPAESGVYSDRSCSPLETIRRLQPHLKQIGITRLARQTSLDVLGIPVFASFRPNAHTLSTNQGKGLSENAAKASALMEAVEFSFAEQPTTAITYATTQDLRGRGLQVFEPLRSMPVGESIPDDRTMAWLQGASVLTGQPILVPFDAATFTGKAPTLPGICQNTNGLASGNTSDEAVFHALCELVERDAGALWALSSEAAKLRSCIDPAAFGDGHIDRMASSIAAADLVLKIFDQTTDLAVPTFLAVIGPQSLAYEARFSICSGSGSHPVARRAAIRAITEAAQSRITTIASARDDLAPDDFNTLANSTFQNLLDAKPAHRPGTGLPLGTPLAELLSHLIALLAAAEIGDITVVSLGGEAIGVSVCKVLAPGLEDWAVNLNWRPGPRALRQMLSDL
ncbi:YcaO-like family protein [Devosia sp.]|uniref:YcaO-like family protein n=1 Tax=Devosia sp. TaxID=1871048 RepID=UPI003265CD9E